jgi:MATE family multidrug resistance protein
MTVARVELRETLKLALPIAFAQVALMAMGTVDAALVGHISGVELAAVSIGNAVTFAAICTAMGVTQAVEPLAAQAVGAGQPERAWTSFRGGILACLALSLPTMLLAVAGTYGLGLLGVDAEVAGLARGFVYARLPGIPAWLAFMGAKAYLEARGLTRPLLIAGWAVNVLNFAVAALLVFGDAALVKVGLPKLGLPPLASMGAGLANSFSTWCLALWALGAVYLARPTGSALFSWSAELGDMARTIARVGVPIGLQLLAEVGVFALASPLAGRLGAHVAAAHQIAIGLASLTFMGVIGIGAATAVRVGRAIGAQELGGPRRAGFTGIGVATAYMSLCGIMFVFCARPLARLFTEDEQVIEAAVPLLRIAAAFQIFDGIQGVASGALRGAGDTAYAFWANVACHWGIGLPVSLVLCFQLGMGASGLWWGLSAGLAAVSAVLLVRFERRTRGAISAILGPVQK